MKYFIYLLTIIILLGLNLGLFQNFRIAGQMPNLLLLLLLFFVLEKKDFDFFFVALVSGLFLDFYSAGFFGAFTMAFLAVGLCLHLFATSVIVVNVNWKTLSLVLFICLTLFNLIVWAFGLLAFRLSWTGQYAGINIFASEFLAAFIYNWLMLYPIYSFFTFLRNFVDNLIIRRRGLVR